MVSIACVADRLGRNHRSTGKKSASKIGSTTIFIAWGMLGGRRTWNIAHSATARPFPGRPNAPGPRGTIRAGAKRLLEFGEHPLDPILVLHERQGDPIHPSRTPIPTDPPPRRLPQDVTPVDTVIQGMETAHSAAWPQSIADVAVLALSPPTAPHPRLRQTAACRGSWTEEPRPCPHAYLLPDVTKVRALPSRRVLLHADHRYYDPVGLPLHSGRFHHRLIRPVSARQAAQTGLSCSVPTLRACRRPYPEETPHNPGTRRGRHGLRRDMSGSALPLWV